MYEARLAWVEMGCGRHEEAKALAEATTKEGGNGEVEAETEGEAGQRGYD